MHVMNEICLMIHAMVCVGVVSTFTAEGALEWVADVRVTDDGEFIASDPKNNRLMITTNSMPTAILLSLYSYLVLSQLRHC